MSSNRWEQIQELYHAALELEPGQRSAFIKRACGGDEAVRQEVEALLAEHGKADGFLETPALNEAAQAQAAEIPSRSLVGKTLGAYQILSLLGTGGMGEVYKARDGKLKRLVALKVLPPDKTSDADRKRRFVQEARAASALNHPNIITIHDIESENGIDFVVMEHVAGKPLDRLIPRRGLKLSDALKYAIQIADGLAKAHSAGIIHRDLKPGNLMVTEDGLVKVLDFGLAKLTERQKATDESSSATVTRVVETEPGTVLGTVSYMSPEQAEGKGVDARSDIFSFGSLLYEMVTGQCAFQGDSSASTLAAILTKDPKPAREIGRSVPQELERVINRCLRKDPTRRFQHMDDLRVALQELKEETDSGAKTGSDPARPASRNTAPYPRRTWVWLPGAFVVLALAIGVWLLRRSSEKPQAALEVIPLTTYPGSERSPSFSPDGDQVAFSWNGEKQDNFDIYVKQIGSTNPPERLTTHPAEDVSPAFSPDGRSIGFCRVVKGRATFIIIPSIGGPERSVAEIPAIGTDRPGSNGPLFAWLPDGKRIVTQGLMLLSIETRETRSLTSPLPPSELFTDAFPAASSDGHTIAFGRSFSFFNWSIYLLDLDQDLKPKAEPRQLTFSKELNWSPTWTSNGQEIVFVSGWSLLIGSLRRVKASGQAEPQDLPYGGGEAFWPAISRNGNRLAYQKDLSDSNIWRLPLSNSAMAAGPPVRYIASTRRDLLGQYSSDGKRIVFVSNRTGAWSIWVCDTNGANAVELFSQAGKVVGSPSWSLDGTRIAFDSNLEGNMDIYVVRASGSGGKPVPLAAHDAEDNIPSWSRDGNWVYFTSLRGGRRQVWKTPAGGGKAVQVTKNGGFAAMESADGRSVFYTNRIDQAPMTGIDQPSMALWKIPVNGGEESLVLPSVVVRAFTPVDTGIYFVPEPGTDGKYFIQFLNFATGKVKMVAPIERPLNVGFSVSPDEHSILYSQVDESSSDLMLVENFR
jgi:serine/threonine protein kinase